MNRVTRLLAVIGAASVVAPAAAMGQAGVTIDPGSPSAKEYALPVEAARRDASGGEGGAPVRPGAVQSPLFGAGVSREEGGASGRPSVAAQRSANGATVSKKQAPRVADSPAAGLASPASPPRHVPEKASAGSSTALIGGGLIVLLIAALGGTALRVTRGSG